MDTEAYIEFRRQKIEELINAASPEQQKRLRAIQNGIDMKLSTLEESNTIGRMILLQEMMWKKFIEFQSVLNDFSTDKEIQEEIQEETNIIDFKRKKK